MKKTKLEKGITLVALIITIVVLLILAVVSIGAVKNSGIIGHATNTSEAWKQAEANEASYLQGYEEKLAESSGAKVVKYVDEVPIPAGFEYVEGDADSGLVIRNKTEGSEFVWIPVDSGSLPSVIGKEPAVCTQAWNSSTKTYEDGADMDSTYLAKAGITEGVTTGVSEKNSNIFLTQLTAEYDAMKASVEHYGGFYVGRYEVSNNSGKAQSVAGVKPATSSSSSVDTWYGLYKLCKTYKTSSVTSSMIWGSQYDAMMTFIGDEANKTGRVSHDLSSIYLTGNGEGDGEYSGGIEYNDIINNIYDLEGNAYEWTLEAYNADIRVFRGGFYHSSISPSNRCYDLIPSYNEEEGLGSRLALYIEL